MYAINTASVPVSETNTKKHNIHSAYRIQYACLCICLETHIASFHIAIETGNTNAHPVIGGEKKETETCSIYERAIYCTNSSFTHLKNIPWNEYSVNRSDAIHQKQWNRKIHDKIKIQLIHLKMYERLDKSKSFGNFN